MENLSVKFIAYLQQQSWQIALLVLFVVGTTYLLRRRSAHVRYLLWMVVLAKCLVPPCFDVSLAVLPDRDSNPAYVLPSSEVGASIPIKSAAPELSPIVIVPVQTSSSLWSLLQGVSAVSWMIAIWLVGIVILTIAILIRAMRLHRRIRNARIPLPEAVRVEVENNLRGMQVKQQLSTWLLPNAGQPFVWGVVKGGIYLPSHLVHTDRISGMREVLAHELCHVLRYDAFVNLLQTLAQILFWFHPCVWWANRQLRIEREKCCDEMALFLLGETPKQYGRAIVDTLTIEVAAPFTAPTLAIAGPVRNIENRIKTILEPGRQFLRGPRWAVVLCAVLVALVVLPINLKLTQSVSALDAVPPLHDQTSEQKTSRTEIVPEGDPPAAIQAGFAIWQKRLNPKQILHSQALELDDRGLLYPIGDLLALDEISWDENDPAWIQAGSLVNYLIEFYDRAGRDTQAKFLQLYQGLQKETQRDNDTAHSFYGIYGESLVQFEAKWRELITQQAWRQVLIDAYILEATEDANDLYIWLAQHDQNTDRTPVSDPETLIRKYKYGGVATMLTLPDLERLTQLVDRTIGAKVLANPQVLANVTQLATIGIKEESYFPKDPKTGKMEEIELGITLSCTVHIDRHTNNSVVEFGLETCTIDFPLDANGVAQELPIFRRRSQKSEFTTDDQHAFLTSIGPQDGKQLYITIKTKLIDP